MLDNHCMRTQRTYKVSEVSRATGVSVRTLHYYEELGLLVPSGRTETGYRLYTDADVLRLQQILIQRELGMRLEDVRRWLDDPAYDHRQALLDQRRQLEERSTRTLAMLNAIDHALDVLEETDRRSEMDVDFKELFDGFDPAEYEAEAEERWGQTDAYKISQARVRSFTEADWLAIKNEQAGIYADAFSALQSSALPESTLAMDVAERHRHGIERFYPCSYAMHVGLADMYEADARFAENIDKYGQGLTRYLSAAIRANARRHQS